MSLPAYALCSLADLKDEVRAQGIGVDALLERIIGRCSLGVEARALRGRRVIYRGPIESSTSVVNVQAFTSGALTLAGQPAGARTLLATLTGDTDRTVTAGVVTVTGTVGGVPGQTETFDFGTGAAEIHGVKFFTAVSAAALAGAVGGGAGDKVSVGTSKGYVEYHSPGLRSGGGGVYGSGGGIYGSGGGGGYDASNYAYGPPILYTTDWPIQNVYEVNEDYTRAFASPTVLVADTDYLLNARDGELRRLSGSYEGYWLKGLRSVRLIHSAGYAGLAAVPQDIADFTLRLAALTYREIVRQQQGITSQSDVTGNVTVISRFASSSLTEAMCEELAEHRMVRYGPLPERDAA